MCPTPMLDTGTYTLNDKMINGLHQKRAGYTRIDSLCTDITIVDSSFTCDNHGQMEGPIIMIFTAHVWQITHVSFV